MGSCPDIPDWETEWSERDRMIRCPDIPDWETEWSERDRMIRRRGPFRCVTHTGGASHGIGSRRLVFGLRLPDLGVAISQEISTGEYLDGLSIRGTPLPSDFTEPRNSGTDFHSAAPHFEGHDIVAGPGGCLLMGQLPCYSHWTGLWDDAFEAWRDHGEDAIWEPLETRLREWADAG